MKIDPDLKAICDKYGLNTSVDLWSCHGQLVAYHKSLERIARQAKIEFDAPYIIEGNGETKCVAVCVTGNMGDASEWSIGEASPHNYKTSTKMAAFPYAMAEKRAKDRVILKLLGLHGFICSEEEADDFKRQNQKSAHKARADGDWENLTASMQKQQTLDALNDWAKNNKSLIDQLPANWQNLLREEFAKHKSYLESIDAK
jgi:hypothetical protein